MKTFDFPYRILIVGKGGQGLTFMGELLLRAAIHEGHQADMQPFYQKQIRGGLTRVRVDIARQTQPRSISDAFNIGILMHPEARQCTLPLTPSPLLIDAYAMGFAQYAQAQGFMQGLNMLVLSHLIHTTQLCSPGTMAWILKQKLGRKRIQYMPINLDFLEWGGRN